MLYEVDVIKLLSRKYKLKVAGYSQVKYWYLANENFIGCLENNFNVYTLKLSRKDRFTDWNNCEFEATFYDNEELNNLLHEIDKYINIK